jgi:RNA polymerase sigma-70 factor (ECF subfamily)
MLFLKHIGQNRKKPGLAESTDEELVKLYVDTGDDEFISHLFDRYTHLVFGVCMKYLQNEHDSKDGVMQIFEKLMDDLPRLEIDNFKAWLYTVSKNHCLMKIRKTRSHERRVVELKINEEQFVDSIEILHHIDGDGQDEKVLQLKEALGKLNTEQKQCVELMYLQQMSYKQVATTTGFTMKQVKSHIQNGKRNLKIILEKKRNE